MAHVLALGLVGVAVEAAAAGSWVADASLPVVRQRGRRYVSPKLAPRPTTPTAGHGITRVHWRYGYNRPGDPHRMARLCAAGRCVDATRARGWSDAFAGLPVTTPFRLVLRMPGTGRVTPVLRGGHVQLVVDFE
ncbi:flagellar protein FlhE [Salinisphaera sp.]|uniref:flagellar protein FlhE n=1 Tax=Salinisphaera sp. TaxID=1914330 RepID=UPI002D77E5B1|nr:flagellar protein FlhE [Salinisphaera sp.]HET7313508.1 flagellar protein FlhE [Salinisphaera sp.]